MKKMLLGLVVVISTSHASSYGCFDAYKKAYDHTIQNKVLKDAEADETFGFFAGIGALVLPAVGAGIGSAVHGASYESPEEFSGATLQEARDKAYLESQYRDKRNSSFMKNGALIAAGTVVSSAVSILVRDAVIQSKANQYLKVLEIVRGANGYFSEEYDKFFNKIYKIDPRINEVILNQNILNTFTDVNVACPADRPQKFKKFKKTVINLMLANGAISEKN